MSQIQARWTADRIERALPDVRAEITIVKTTGDRIRDRSLMEIGGQGVFTKELDAALLENRIDLAVHSLKDLPTRVTDGLYLAAVPERADPRDVWIGRESRTLEALPAGAVVGTGSLRRRAQILALRPDLKAVDIRGNVDTRIRKVYESEDLSGVILAAAGVLRLGRESEITEFLELENWLPAPGQGALAIVTRHDDEAVREIAAIIDHTATRTAVSAERALLAHMKAGCHVPVGAWGHIEGDALFLNGFIGHPDGLRIVRGRMHGPAAEPQSLGVALAEQLLTDGGHDVLDDLLRSGRI